MGTKIEKGPIVYRGGKHYVTCDSDGWHRSWWKKDGELIGLSCRCENWAGGCPKGRRTWIGHWSEND